MGAQPATILVGDVRQRLRDLPAGQIRTCVTSPPYYGLRSYGTEPQLWGGQEGCEHVWETERTPRPNQGGGATEKQSTNTGSFAVEQQDRATYSDTCALCGAWRGELGQEPTPELFIAHLVEVFREVWRVLSDDGTLWLNLGDSYAAGKAKTGYSSAGSDLGWNNEQSRLRAPSCKPKDLIGIPWMAAFALRADGWYLRAELPWLKRNGMCSSVEDRPNTCTEKWFLFSKSQRYFYDHWAVRRDGPEYSGQRGTFARQGGKATALEVPGHTAPSHRSNRTDRVASGRNFRDTDLFFETLEAPHGLITNAEGLPLGLDVTTSGFSGAHYATFPPRLIRPLILASTSAHGKCADCGKPWVRVIETGEPDREHQRACGGDRNGEYHGQPVKDYTGTGAENASEVKARVLAGMKQRQTVKWEPTCACETDVVPDEVLDPFIGSGTTAQVALGLGRHCTGVELLPANAEMVRQRVAMFAEIAAPEPAVEASGAEPVQCSFEL